MNLDKKPNQKILTHLNQKTLLPNILKLEEGLKSNKSSGGQVTMKYLKHSASLCLKISYT